MDYQYAMMKFQYGGVDVTQENKEYYVAPYRMIQNRCFSQFYCPNATTMDGCPDGHRCADSTVEPLPCVVYRTVHHLLDMS